MKMAYIQWLGQELRKADPAAYPEGSRVVVGEEHETLPTVVHWHSQLELKVNEKICEETGCERCRTGRGGYQFRWYSPLWYTDYLRGRTREDSWKLGDPES